MTQDPEWGVPGSLYLDNGGEYNWASFADDAMRLSGLTIGYLGDDADAGGTARRARASMTVRARPYNVPAKPIEGLFGLLEGGPLRMLPGWIGGERTKKKTANVGKAPEPFPGGAAAFRKVLETALDYYHTVEQSGNLAGKSPRQAFASAVAAGWRRVDIDPHALEAAFAREITRKVAAGGTISYRGRDYRHDALMAHATQTVRVRVPLAGSKERLVILDDATGDPICVAKPAPEFAFMDPAGGREQGRQARALQRTVADRRRETDSLDLTWERRDAAALHEPAPPPDSAGIIRLSEQIEAIAARKRQPPELEDRPSENAGVDLWRRFGGGRAFTKGTRAGGE